MPPSRIVAEAFGTAVGDNPEWMALVASGKGKTVEVVFQTMQAPLVAASVLEQAQEAVKDIAPAVTAGELAWNLDSSMQITPEAAGIALAGEGNVLCVNVGSGMLAFKLTDTAKAELKQLCALLR